MANNSLNISIPLKLDVKSPPRGMTDYDIKTLSPDQQQELNLHKKNLRKENIIYLMEHPEIRALICLIIRRTITLRPGSVIEYIANYFTRPQHVIEKEIQKVVNESTIEYDPIPYAKYEKWDY